MSVVFEEPRATKGRKSWPERLEPLKERPGEWARVFESTTLENARQYASGLKKPGRYALPEGRFEFRAGPLKNGKGGVYARYIGGP